VSVKQNFFIMDKFSCDELQYQYHFFIDYYFDITISYLLRIMNFDFVTIIDKEYIRYHGM
jgi:hypothetical protein